MPPKKANVPIVGWSWLLPPGPRLSLGAGCGSGCGAGGEDRQEFQILIFGSKCPPTTATTITAINTAIFFSITITISFPKTIQQFTKVAAVKREKDTSVEFQELDLGWTQVTSVICVSNRGSCGRGVFNIPSNTMQ